MEIADIRRRVRETIERARRTAAERRAGSDAAAVEYERFLDQVATPIFRQVAMVLRTENHSFTVFTPTGSVRLMSDKSGQDFIELSLDTSGGQARVVGHSCHARGRSVMEAERPIAEHRRIADLTEEDVLTYVLKELEPLVER